MNESVVREIKVSTLFYYVLSKWRILIIGALVGALILGLYGGIHTRKKSLDDRALKEAQATYEEELQDYETKKEALQDYITGLENNLAQQEYIQDRSVMLEMDPYNIYETSIGYYIDNDYKIMPELYYQDPNHTVAITNYYNWSLLKIDLDELFATKDRPEAMTENPVSDNSESLLWTKVDAENGTLRVFMRADSQEQLERLEKAVEEKMDETQKILNETIGTHTLSVLDSTSQQTMDFDYLTLQQSFNDNYHALIESLTKANDELSNLEEPKAPSNAAGDLKKKTIEFGIIGLILGFCIVALANLIIVLSRDPVLGSDDVGERYHIPVLGFFTDRNGRKKNRFDRFLTGKLGAPNSDHEESVEYIKAAKALYPLGQEILLVSTSVPDRLQNVSNVLSEADPETSYVAAGDLMSSAPAVNSLSGAESVICVEKWLKSGHGDVKKELAMVCRAVSPDKIAMILIQ